MTAAPPPTPGGSIFLSPAARITLSMSSVFGAWGMASPFLPRWMEVERAMSGAEIGAVLSAAMLARIVMGPAIAAWCDGFADRRTALRLLTTGAVLSWAAMFFLAQGFWALFAIGFIAQTLGQTLSPLNEAAALRASATDHRLPFGTARAIGSAAFILGNVGGGAAIAAIGLGAVPAWVLSGLVLAAAATWFALPSDPSPRVQAGFRKRLRAGFAYARNPRTMVLLAGCSCIQAGHSFYYGFSALVWRGQGISAADVGVLWGFAVSAEIVLLLLLPRIERRVTPDMLILIGAAGGVVRWSLLALAPVGWLLWPLQLIHALTFSPAHIGALRIIARDTPEEMSIFMQTLYASLQAGLFMGAATLASGWLYDRFNAGGYWLMAALAAAGFALIWRFRQMPKAA